MSPHRHFTNLCQRGAHMHVARPQTWSWIMMSVQVCVCLCVCVCVCVCVYTNPCALQVISIPALACRDPQRGYQQGQSSKTETNLTFTDIHGCLPCCSNQVKLFEFPQLRLTQSQCFIIQGGVKRRAITVRAHMTTEGAKVVLNYEIRGP